MPSKTKSSPLVTLVVPTYNEAKYIRPLIAALRRQSDRRFQVIAVDKHSTDGTVRLCRQAGWNVVSETTAGIAAARAQGFALADTPYIAATDADSQPPPHWISDIISAFQTRPGAVCLYGPAYFPSTSPKNRLGNRILVLFLLTNRLLKNDHIMGMNFAVRASAYQAVGGFNRALKTAEDVDLGYRIRKVGSVVYLPRLYVITSDRRMARMGVLSFARRNIANFLRLKLLGRATSDFQPIR